MRACVRLESTLGTRFFALQILYYCYYWLKAVTCAWFICMAFCPKFGTGRARPTQKVTEASESCHPVSESIQDSRLLYYLIKRG